MSELPIFNPDKLAESMKTAADKAITLVKTEAEAWVNDNREDFEALGEDLVKAILFKVAHDTVPVIVVGTDTPQELVTEAEAINAHRNLVFSLVAKAQKDHSERAARVEKSAKSLVLKIGAAGAKIGAAGATLLIRSLIGG